MSNGFYTYECPDCQGEVIVRFSDRVLGTELIWSASHKCDRCNYRVEEDFGQLPDRLHNLLLDREGFWGIYFQTAIGSNIIALKIIRQALDLSLNEVRHFLHESSTLLPIGTKAETYLVVILLQKNGIDSEIVQIV